MAKPVTIAGMYFATRKDLHAHVKQEIGQLDRITGVEGIFQSAVLAECYSRHYQESPAPIGFSWEQDAESNTDYPSPTFVAVLSKDPYRFVVVSHTALLGDPPDANSEKSMHEFLSYQLRQRWESHWKKTFMPKTMTCEFPGCERIAEDVHHVSPTHKELVLECEKIVTAQDYATWLKERSESKLKNQRYSLPEESQVIQRYDKLTASGNYLRLCKAHHHSLK